MRVQSKNRRFLGVLAPFVLALLAPKAIWACGCLHSPAPQDVTEEFAVNQRAEQILFEVEEGTVTAHVYIRYSGAPERFAWLLPVPNLPELALSPPELFAVLDELTGPTVEASTESVCPVPEYACGYGCWEGEDEGGDEATEGEPQDASSSEGPSPSPVTVLAEEIVGDYLTVVFSAEDAALTVSWLIDNGFIVNETLTPYMQPYLDQKMLFVAAKLLPGKGIDGIKPLRLTYQAAKPMIPLVLTAPAADPHMTVTAYIAADTVFRPDGGAEVDLDMSAISSDRLNRANYPMVLARAVDEAGGRAFFAEFRSFFPMWVPNAESGCCGWNAGRIECGIANNGQCECPGTEEDDVDCLEKAPGLVEAAKLLEELRGKHSHLTRLTSRISPEEMTFDPVFAPLDTNVFQGRRFIEAPRYTLNACRGDVVDLAELEAVEAIEACTTVYCGTEGQCVAVSPTEAGCACNPGYVAQTFVDLDGLPSVTCVPEIPTVDLQVDSSFKQSCFSVDCGLGTCVDRNGFASCGCDPESVAVTELGASAPLCVPGAIPSGSPGAQRFTETLLEVDVCVPAPPDCWPSGWLYPITPIQPPNAVYCGQEKPPAGTPVGTSYCDGPEEEGPGDDVSGGEGDGGSIGGADTTGGSGEAGADAGDALGDDAGAGGGSSDTGGGSGGSGNSGGGSGGGCASGGSTSALAMGLLVGLWLARRGRQRLVRK